MTRKLDPVLLGLLLALIAPIPPVVAAVNPTVPPDVSYVTGSTRKISQLIGDTDFERLTPTETRTQSRYGITGSDLGVPFTHNGVTCVVFGDTLGGLGGGRDPFAFTTDTDPEDGMQLTFLSNGSTWRPITIAGISQGAFEVPLDGVSVNNKMYLYHSTDHSASVTMGRSVLAVSADNGLNFQLLYTLSRSNFINVSVNKVNLLDWPGTPLSSGDGLFLFGSGAYRASNVRLAFQPASAIEDVTALRYFTGLDAAGGPLWSTNEADAIALFDQPSVGELSVAWNKFIKRWVMLYNSGNPRGINFRTARQPWGPWSQPQVLFKPWNDGGYAHFMHANWTFRNFDNVQNPGRENEWGGEYGPYMFKELATGSDNRTTIYFTMSVWNPYVAVLMKTELTVNNAPVITISPADQRAAEGESATFQLIASAVGTLAYRWQRSGTDIPGATSNVLTLPSVSAVDDGVVFRCVVSNASGSVTSNPVRLLVTGDNAPPVPQIVSPAGGALYRGGETISFSGVADDAEDGALPPSAFRWQVLFQHVTHSVPFLGTLSGVTNGSFTVPTRGEQATNVFFRVLLTVTDSGGRETTVFRDILPRTSTLTLASDPAGLRVLLDGASRVTPAVVPCVVGMSRTLSTVTPASSGGRNLDWQAWSDGGGLTHFITIPETNAAYTAVFRTPTTLVPTNAQWKYLVTPSAPGSSWNTIGFNDSAWPAGAAQLGFGDGDEATVVGYGPDPNNKYVTTYFRRTFTVADPSFFAALLVRLLRDDGGVVYLNGTEIFRSNMGGGAPAYRTEAPAIALPADETTQFYATTIAATLLRPGTNVIAAEIHQSGVNSSDLSFALELRGAEHDGLVSVAASTPAAELGPVPGAFIVTRSEPISNALTVGFQLGGTALAGSDYSPIGSSISFAVNEASKTIVVMPIADNTVEGSETVQLSLQTGAGYTLGASASAMVTIADKPFDAWRFTHGLINSSETADPDGDGAVNLLEYAVGSDPNTSAPASYPIISRIGGQLTLTYQRLRVAAEIAYRVEVSSELLTWDYGSAFVEEIMQPDGLTVVARDLAPAGSSNRLIRIRVIRLQ